MAARASEGAAKDRAVGGYRAGARALLGEAELMSRIIRLLRDVISALELSIDGIIRFGFPDPSDTGRIYGYFCMLLPLIGKNCELHVHPMFQEELLEASISCSFSVCPYHLALLIGGFLFDFSNWQAAKRLLIQGKRARPKGG
jgi:hypothetical protein